MDDARPLHDALRPLEPLLGTWRGTGAGKYPGIDDFEYAEEARFWHYGKPVLAYSQRTWSPATGAPMHSEMGFWRPAPGGIEVVLAHAFGIAEVLGGQVEGGRFTLRSEALTAAATAKHVGAVGRIYEVEGETLTYDVQMAFGDHELQPHLRAELRRAAR